MDLPKPLDLGLDASTEDIIDVALGTVRKHLGMEVAYLSEFVDGKSVFRAVSAPGLEALIKPGDSQNLDDVYCQHILDGRLPNVIQDTANEPICQALPITKQVPIRSHVSVPVTREDGSVYGMFCCLSPTPNPSLNDRDLAVMQTFADLAKKQLNTSLRSRAERDEARQRIQDVMDAHGFRIVLQPIFPLGSTRPAGFESLCRFEAKPYRPPNIWFDEAFSVGRQLELELAVIECALASFETLPADIYLSVNASPGTVASGRLPDIFKPHPQERIVLELTEHAVVDDYAVLEAELRVLAFAGVRIAIDDVGAGHSGLSHILKIKPDLLKLDMELTKDVDTDVARQSLVKGMVHFADACNAKIIAEGIEKAAEAAKLSELGVALGQGYHLGKPDTMEAALAWFAEEQVERAG